MWVYGNEGVKPGKNSRYLFALAGVSDAMDVKPAGPVVPDAWMHRTGCVKKKQIITTI